MTEEVPQPLMRMRIRVEQDIFAIRQLGREVARTLGLETQDQTRLATALSDGAGGATFADGLGDSLTLRGVSAATLSANPGQVAFARYQEGVLALQAGDVPEAEHAYAAGVAVAPSDITLLHLDARLALAAGDVPRAVVLFRSLVGRRPIAAYAVEAAAVLTRAGDVAGARDLVALAQAQLAVSRANGVNADPNDVVLEATYGSPTTALAMAQSLWSRQRGVYAADAFAVALHAAGRDGEALRFEQRALSLGTTTPSLRQHLTAIRNALAAGSR